MVVPDTNMFIFWPEYNFANMSANFYYTTPLRSINQSMTNANVWYSKDLKVPCCSSLHLFAPNNRTARMTSEAVFGLYFLRWGEIFIIIRGQAYIWFCDAKNCRRNIFLIWSKRIILVASPLARPPANSCETMLLPSCTPFLFPKTAPVCNVTLCPSLWHCVGGPGGTTGTSPRMSSKLYSTRVQSCKC